MVAASVPDAQAQGTNFFRARGAAHIDTGRTVQTSSGDANFGQHVDDGLFDPGDEFADFDFAAGEVDQQVNDHLTGAVVGDLPTAVDLDDGNADVAQQMFRLAGLPQGIDGRVFDQPQFVRSVFGPRRREAFHGFPRGLVINAPQTAQQQIAGDFRGQLRHGPRWPRGRL